MSVTKRFWPDDRAGQRSALICLFVVLAIGLGGGGSPHPLAELLLQMSAATILAALAWSAGDARALPSRTIWAICAIVLAIPVLQLVPLPPVWWQALPGREGQRAALDLVGLAESWRPLSIAPHKTLASLLAMVVPLALALLVAGENTAGRRRILATVALMALASAVLGTLQVAGPGDAFRLYDGSHTGWLTGFHANRNAAADLLLIGAVAAAARFAMRERQDGVTSAIGLTAALGVLLVALLLTGSRAGIMLVSVAAAGIAIPVTARQTSRRNRWSAGFALVAALVIVLSAFAIFDQRLGYAAARFGMFDDTRIALWQDGARALAAGWPWGTGMGTFVDAFLPHEQLMHVDASMPNRAHSEWLEFAIEAGMPGYTVLATAIVLGAALARRSLGDPASRPAAIFALTSFILVALHALIDYPLRNMAGASLVAIALGMLARPQEPDTDGT